jgi:hypothetical protein
VIFKTTPFDRSGTPPRSHRTARGGYRIRTMRRSLSWLLTIPLVIAGTELAHAVGYRSAVPDAHERAHELAATGHGYFAFAPLAVGLGIAILVVALVLHGGSAATARLRAWPFAVLPLLTFTLQEHLERLLHGVSVSGLVFEPTFVRGALLQLPFGLIAYLIARALVRVAERIGAALRSETPRLQRPVTLFPPVDTPFRPVLLVAGCGVRGPPARL